MSHEQQSPNVDPRHVWPLKLPQAPSIDTLSVEIGLGAEDVAFPGISEDGAKLVIEREADDREQDSVAPGTVTVVLEVLVIVVLVVGPKPGSGVTVDVDVNWVMLYTLAMSFRRM